MTTTPKPNAAERLRAEAEHAMDNGAGMNLTRYIGEKRLLADFYDEAKRHLGYRSRPIGEQRTGLDPDYCSGCAELIRRAEKEEP